jgi:serine/threonine-protein kinase HipA
MAMNLGSKYIFNEVQARHWDQFAEAAGFSIDQARQRILMFANKLPSVAHEVEQSQAFEFSDNPLVKKIIHEIEKRASRIIQILS